MPNGEPTRPPPLGPESGVEGDWGGGRAKECWSGGAKAGRLNEPKAGVDCEVVMGWEEDEVEPKPKPREGGWVG